MDKITELESKIVDVLRTVFDPEIPVNVYDLGLIHKIEVSESFDIEIDMTLTSPNCPMVDQLIEDVTTAIKIIPETKGVSVNIVFEPPWSQDSLSDEAKLDLGLL